MTKPQDDRTEPRRAALQRVRLYVITDAQPRVRPVEAFLERVIQAGAGMIQLREQHLEDGALLHLARRCAQVCRERGALFIVNDRVDIALGCEADGVHVGQDDVPVADARRMLGSQRLIGLSTHAPEQVDAAQQSGADYFAVGPVHATPTKPGRPAAGIALVEYAAARARLPFFAIGGLEPSNIGEVFAAGGDRVCVLRCVCQSPQPELAVRTLLERFGEQAAARL
ncbi:MAG: thiamine phosphate synthase [Candidatus Eremiobacteraeota bacterium]|nr:thiamine phosphate synthase [Candidatus Eremiobacteraeota bacterium]